MSSNANYNVLFEEHGEKATAQVHAFDDTWERNADSRAAYEEVVEAGDEWPRRCAPFAPSYYLELLLDAVRSRFVPHAKFAKLLSWSADKRQSGRRSCDEKGLPANGEPSVGLR